MKFEGDLTKFFPPDLLIFLANLGEEGLLTVKNGRDVIFISLRKGIIVDAQSKQADNKILIKLLFDEFIDKKQYKHIEKAKKETGMPIRQILEKLNLFPLENIREIIKTSIQEALFHFFLWESGEFQFVDIPLGSDAGFISLKPQLIALEISKWVDEWHEIKRKIVSFDSIVSINKTSSISEELDLPEKIVLKMAKGNHTVSQIIYRSPLTSLDSLKAFSRLLQKTYLKLHYPEKIPIDKTVISQKEELFLAFKKTFKKITRAKRINDKLKNLTYFCDDHFDQSYIISTSHNKLLHCIALYKGKNGNRKMKKVSNMKHNIHDDLIFSRVFDSGIAFFGNIFKTEIIKGILELPKTGECAIIPLSIKPNLVTLIFVVSANENVDCELSPFHYLELLSSLINPLIEEDQHERNTIKQPSASPVDTPDKTKSLLKIINDLPPMPHIATKVLRIISDPDSAITDLIEILSQDQSLTALLIRVSNSALYRSGQVINSLSDAATRLGTKAIRSLVLASSTRSLFPKDNKKLELLGHSLWQHSKECGLASRRVAEKIGYYDPDEAFIGGVIHDIGKLAILLKFPEEYLLIQQRQSIENLTCADLEKNKLGFDHIELGALLMKKWNMPDGLKACVQYHHDPTSSMEFEKLSFIVSYGNYLSHVHGIQKDNPSLCKTNDIESMIKKMGLSPEEEIRFNDNIIEDFQHADLFD
jgi:HD-like signal output (HDOD) protein